MYSNPFAPEASRRPKESLHKSSSFVEIKKDPKSTYQKHDSNFIMKLDVNLLEKTKRELNEKQVKLHTPLSLIKEGSAIMKVQGEKFDSLRTQRAKIANRIIEIILNPISTNECQTCDRFLPERAYYVYNLCTKELDYCYPRLLMRDKTEWNTLMKHQQKLDEEAHAIEHVISILRENKSKDTISPRDSMKNNEERSVDGNPPLLGVNSTRSHDEITMEETEE